MIRRNLRSLPLCCLLSAAMVLLGGDLVAAAAAQGAAGPKEPTFSKDASRESFAKGKALFSEGKFKEAERLFKRVKLDTKSKEDKSLVESWVLATAGGLVIEKLKNIEASGKLKTYDQTQFYYRKYRPTPARANFEKYLKELEAKIFVVLENFDIRTRSYSAKYGKTFVNDPRLALDGTQCLRWANTKKRSASALKVTMQGPGAKPKDWSGFTYLQFWVNVTIPPRGAGVVLMCGAAPDPKKKAGTPGAKSNFFQGTLNIAGKKGYWTQIRLPLTGLRKGGDATLSNIEYLQLQIPAGMQFDLLLDNMVLIRNDGAGARSRARR